MSPENFAYISGAYVSTVETVRSRQAFAVIPRNGQPFAVFCSIQTATMKDESWIEDFVEYTEFADDPIDVLIETLKARGLGSGRLGIDLAYLPQASYRRLERLLSDAEVVDTTETVASVRVIKEPDEIEKLERAARSTHEAVLGAMAAARLGESERVMANRISKGIIDGGADTTFLMYFGSGERSISAHGGPSERVPKESEIVRFDVGGRYHMFTSDFARTFSTGHPTDEQRETYSKLVGVHKETIGSVRPGVMAEDLFFTCKESFAKRGLPFHMPHIGHSFGVEFHEDPMLRPGDRTPLEPGMVINIEPVVIDSLRSRYHIEDLFVVTDDGYRLLTLGFPQDEIPVIGTRVAS